MLHTFDTRLESMDGFETDFVKTLYYDLDENYDGKYRSLGYLRFCTILEGEKHLSVGDKKLKYTPEQFLILPANSTVDMHIPKPTKALVFEISDELIKQVASKVEKEPNFRENASKDKIIIPSGISKESNSSFILGNHNNNIKEYVNHIYQLTKPNSKNEAFMVDLYSQKLVYDLLKKHSVDELLSLKASSELSKTFNYIKTNIHEPIKVSQLSQIAGMSESNFSHSFKKTYGQSPQKFINESKLSLAPELLKENSVTAVAYDLGFENLSHFIRLFKEKYKTTPKQYQMTYLR